MFTIPIVEAYEIMIALVGMLSSFLTSSKEPASLGKQVASYRFKQVSTLD